MLNMSVSYVWNINISLFINRSGARMNTQGLCDRFLLETCILLLWAIYCFGCPLMLIGAVICFHELNKVLMNWLVDHLSFVTVWVEIGYLKGLTGFRPCQYCRFICEQWHEWVRFSGNRPSKTQAVISLVSSYWKAV